MANKKGKKSKVKRKRDVNVQYHPDDPRSFKDMPEPDANSQEYYEDAVDQFHTNRDKILLDGAARYDQSSEEEDGQELMSDADDKQYFLSDDEIQKYEATVKRYEKQKWKESMKDDLVDEDDEEDDTLEEKPWGKKKGVYYGDDHREDRFDRDVDDQEEEEAVRLLQKRMSEMTEEDYLDLSHMIPANKKKEAKTEEESETGDVVELDISKIPVPEQVKILKKESPEVFGLYDELKRSRAELNERVEPVLRLVSEGILPDNEAAALIRTKQQALRLYCCNLAFYFVLKTSHTSLLDHPVMERILYFKKLLSELDELEPTAELDTILECSESGHDLGALLVAAQADNNNTVGRNKKKQKRRKQPKSEASASEITADEQPDIEESAQVETMDEEVEDEGKRGIDYEMEKNKGLTAKRKKEMRNPRVKHRLKFRKAKIRRRGQVREVRPPLNAYGGEISGIRAGIIRSTKFKYK